MENNQIKIQKINDEQLNTSKSYYICHVYEVTLPSKEKSYLKFYISFSESFNAEYEKVDKKEIDKIQEYYRLEKLKSNATYYFNFKYSDYFEVDIKTL